MLLRDSESDESIHALAVEIPTNHREIPGSTPGRYNLQIEIASVSLVYEHLPTCMSLDLCLHICVFAC